MEKFFRIIEPIYLLLIGVGIGAIIACGAFAAPIVFKMGQYLNMDSLSSFEGGIIMGKIFMRLNVYLQVLLAVIAIYEIISVAVLKGGVRYFWFILGIINVGCIAVFVWYYSPYLVDVESLANADFTKVHEQSVLVFKILMISLSITFVWRVYKRARS